MTKKKLVVGNWKMELSHKAAQEILRSLKSLVSQRELATEVVICPSYPQLPMAATILKDSSLQIGAQNIHAEERGAFTGQVSVAQLRDFITWSIVGHSEARAAMGDDDALVAHKAQLLFHHGMTPIVCVGETAAERDGEQTLQKISQQIQTLLATIPRTSFTKLVIAYEPIWAIGSGVMPEQQEVSEVVLLIRKLIAQRFDEPAAQRVRILYGGSVTADTVGQYVGEPGVDGVLVGGASVHPRDFLSIIETVERT